MGKIPLKAHVSENNDDDKISIILKNDEKNEMLHNEVLCECIKPH